MGSPTKLPWDGTYEVHTAVELNGKPYEPGDIVEGPAGQALYLLGKAWLNVKGKTYEPKSGKY